MPTQSGYTVTPVADANCTRWVPVVGDETFQFLERVDLGESSESVRQSATSILAQGISPHCQIGRATGLVVGYVQSGKTISFEAVATLAHDNGFPLVIVIAGSSRPLLDQSTKRLRHDLGLDELNRERRWQYFQNPRQGDFSAIRNALEAWSDPRTPRRYRQTVLVTVLKHHKRLQELTRVLEKLNLQRQRIPALVIDDEADQASLNIGAYKGDSSTTYNCLISLRAALPNHTYLQYTATPQAPLLISIIDSLSPDFVHVLSPGNSYVGGSKFFAGDHRYLRRIPSGDLPSKDEPLPGPPESLLDAIRVFLLGVVIGLQCHNNTGNRSMLVHPSHLTVHHQEYFAWVRQVFDDWNFVLSELGESDPDRRELIEDFREAYEDLQKTVRDMPPFDVVCDSLHLAFRYTQVREINTRTGTTPRVDWRNTYGMILVGGQAMDRGFTVEGLTVTYMPRSVGVGNADTIQQRGRFFGYKKSYLDFCRIYLDQDVIDAYTHYVEHEEFMRQQLINFQGSATHLNEWKRMFVLDQALRPCRHQVLEFEYVRNRFSESWIYPRLAADLDVIVSSNREVVDRFLAEIEMTDDSGHSDRTPQQVHKVCHSIRLPHLLANLLTRIRMADPRDSLNNTMLLAQLGRALEHYPEEECSVFLMSGGALRNRAIDQQGEIRELFQGAYPVKPLVHRGKIYPGDRHIFRQNQLTVQIHRLNLKRRDGGIISDVAVVAVWLPERLAQDWLYQDQRVPLP